MSELAERSHSELENEAHRAIGRYIVEFSLLVAQMRSCIEYLLRTGDPMIARLALGGADAWQIATTFFAVCERQLDLDDEEKAIAARFRAEVETTCSERNDIAHGDWHLDLEDARLQRTKPGRKAGAWLERVRPVSEIDAMADRVSVLARSVAEFGWLCLGIHPLNEVRDTPVRVRDIYRFSNRRIYRTGRYANDLPCDQDD